MERNSWNINPLKIATEMVWGATLSDRQTDYSPLLTRQGRPTDPEVHTTPLSQTDRLLPHFSLGRGAQQTQRCTLHHSLRQTTTPLLTRQGRPTDPEVHTTPLSQTSHIPPPPPSFSQRETGRLHSSLNSCSRERSRYHGDRGGGGGGSQHLQ